MVGVYARTPQGKKTRADREPGNRALFDANRKKILATQSICAICGKPVDKTLKSPDPMSATVDHIIPVKKNGDPVSLDNLQLTHRICNRMKSDKLIVEANPVKNENRKLPLMMDWRNF